MKKIIIFSIFFFLSVIAFSQTKTELQVAELQKPIKEHIEKNFDGFSIGKIFKVDAKGTITYDVCVAKGTTYEKLIYDKEGKFLKKESCTYECCQPTIKK
jgi:hypothetical protein